MSHAEIALFATSSLIAVATATQVFRPRRKRKSYTPPPPEEEVKDTRLDVTPVEFFLVPLLKFLYDKDESRSAYASRTLRELDSVLDPDMKPDDRRPCSSEQGILMAWQVSCRLAADRLEELGWLSQMPTVSPKNISKDLPKGFWKLTPKGTFYGRIASEGGDPMDPNLVYEEQMQDQPAPVSKPVFKPRTKAPPPPQAVEIDVPPPRGECPQSGQPYHTMDSIIAVGLAYIKVHCGGRVPSNLHERVEALFLPHLQAGDFTVPGSRKQTRFKHLLGNLKGKLAQQGYVTENGDGDLEITREGLHYLSEYLPQYAA